MILGNFYARLNSKAVLIIGGKTWPKDRRWIIAVSIISLLAVAAYGVEWAAESQVPGGSSRCGLLYGIAGGALIIFELLLAPRKMVRSWRIGSAQSWLRAHMGRPALERKHFQGNAIDRAGNPESISPLAKPTESPHEEGYFVGGGARGKSPRGEERFLGEGTWCTDYTGLLIRKK